MYTHKIEKEVHGETMMTIPAAGGAPAALHPRAPFLFQLYFKIKIK